MKKNFKNDKLISIYITSKNYSSYLTKAIKSVLRQSYKNWELFLIDDGSKDNSYKIMKLFQKKNKKKNNSY